MAKQHPRNSARRWASPAYLCVMCFSLLSSVANAENQGLFSDTEIPQLLEESATDDEFSAIQRRMVRIDFAQLGAARKEVLAQRPAHLALNLFEGVSFRVVLERTAPTSSGYSLSGRLEGVPFGTMALVLNGRIVMGKVRTIEAVYTIRTLGAGTYVIERTDPTEFREGPPLKPAAPTSALDFRTDARATEEDDGSEIDVLVVWTRTARRHAGGTRHIETAIDLAVVETNDAYAASGAAQRIKLVGAVETNYENTGNLIIDLDRLVIPSDGYLDEVHALRDSYAADLVHLASSGTCGSGGVEGLAFAMEDPSASFEASAFSASIFCNLANVLQTNTRTGLSSRLFAHELGHNMGLQHDRYAPYTTLNKPYPYSHGYVNQKAFDDGATTESRWRTIMAYDAQCRAAGLRCPPLLRFSNPNQRYPDDSGHALGIPGDDPSDEVDGPADAVRSLDNTRLIVANFRPSTSRCTYSLAQESLTVPAAGGSFSINVETAQDCAYTAKSHDEFLSVISGASSGGGGEVQYQVAANEGDARVGALSVAGETLVVRQSGIRTVDGVCGRTPAVRDAIIAWTGRDSCSDVNEFDLSEIPYLILSSRGITALRGDDFAGLSNLRTLDLSFNSIGAIPPELGSLINLERLHIRGSRLTGTIPPELGQLTNLKRLHLELNRLTGRIPPELGQLTNLEWLNLGSNKLEGAIPVELSSLSNLIDLSLDNNTLTGAVPAWLGRLTNLGWLRLGNNQLTGAIPADLGRLTNLAVLRVSNNTLAGAIPAELGNIENLQFLDLSGNQLTGGIPRELGSPPILQSIKLDDNELTGTVPAELSDLKNLRQLHLMDNALTGCIPGALGDVSDHDLDELGLEYCAAVSIADGGSPNAPAELGRVSEGAAAALTITANPAQDTAFDVTVAISGGEAFGVAQGNRTVTIPSGMTAATLTVDTADDAVEEPDGAFTATLMAGPEYALFVSRSSAAVVIDDDEGPSEPTITALTPEDGTLTVTWTGPPDSGGAPVTAYDIRHRPTPSAPRGQIWTRIDSATAGALEHDITGLTNRVEYDMQVRAVDGNGDGAWSETATGVPRACPDNIQLSDCRTLLVARDHLVGGGTPLNWAIARPIKGWTGIQVNRDTQRLVQLILSNQGLSGTIPSELSSLSELTLLWLESNQLTGVIPAQLGSLTNLQSLKLGSNRLTGAVPTELGGLTNLWQLSLSGNELTGTLPPQLGGLSNLRSLILHHTGLTGPIPPELGGLTNLVVLWLHGNELTGAIPAELGHLSNLQQLLLDSNELTGSIPAELGRLTNLEALKLSDNQLTGSIPGTLRNLANLTLLSLGGNRLTGCVPAGLRDVARNDLDRLGLPDCIPGAVIGLVIESSPDDGIAYGMGEWIEASVWFDAEVIVSGFPQLALMTGTETRIATFDANRGNGQLSFRYSVGSADRDADGISIAADALSLNGGEIRDVDREHAVLDLGEHAIANHPSHKIRGALRELVPDQELEAGGEALSLDLSRYFDVPEGGTLTYGPPTSSDPALVTATIENGILKIVPHEGEGVATITVTATDDNGVTVTLSFKVAVTAATMRSIRPWLIGVLAAEQEANEAEDNDPQ